MSHETSPDAPPDTTLEPSVISTPSPGTDPEMIAPPRKDYVRWDERKRDRVIEYIRKHGKHMRLAAKYAGVSYETLRQYLKLDDDLRDDIEIANDERCQDLVDEARRRAMDGVTRRKFDKDGNLIEEEQVYSDRLMEKLLDAEMPEKFRHKFPGSTDGAVGGVLLIPVQPVMAAGSVDDLAAQLERLSAKQVEISKE